LAASLTSEPLSLHCRATSLRGAKGKAARLGSRCACGCLPYYGWGATGRYVRIWPHIPALAASRRGGHCFRERRVTGEILVLESVVSRQAAEAQITTAESFPLRLRGLARHRVSFFRGRRLAGGIDPRLAICGAGGQVYDKPTLRPLAHGLGHARRLDLQR